MELKINGKDYDFQEQDITINFVLEKLNITKNVVIELNGEIIKKSEFDSLKLRKNDNMEILFFMGGG